jgi:Mg2+ and Co2+ transporter CorA
MLWPSGVFGMNLEFPHYLQDNGAPFQATVLAVAVVTPVFSVSLSILGHKYGWIP